MGNKPLLKVDSKVRGPYIVEGINLDLFPNTDSSITWFSM